jgi:hypothetical protein
MAITVKSADWNGISSEDQQKIRDIIGENFQGQTVEVGDTAMEANVGNACTTACTIAQQAAEAACSAMVQAPCPGRRAPSATMPPKRRAISAGASAEIAGGCRRCGGARIAGPGTACL